MFIISSEWIFFLISSFLSSFLHSSCRIQGMNHLSTEETGGWYLLLTLPVAMANWLLVNKIPAPLEAFPPPLLDSYSFRENPSHPLNWFLQEFSHLRIWIFSKDLGDYTPSSLSTIMCHAIVNPFCNWWVNMNSWNQ